MSLFDTNRPNDDLSGALSWIKKAQFPAKYYPDGFTNDLTAAGSIYHRPTNTATPVLQLSTASVSFAGGNLPSDFSNQITIAPNNKVTNTSTNKLTLGFAPATGLFTGSVTPPSLIRAYSFRGAVLQKVNAGYGYLIGTNQTSSVLIQ